MIGVSEQKRDFTYTEQEAEIVARCELGVRDNPETFTYALCVMAAVVAGIRVIRKMPRPSNDILFCYLTALSLWFLFLIYISRRLKMTKRDLTSRSLSMYLTETGIDIYEYGDNRRYHCKYSDITLVERGETIAKLSGVSGRICIPLRLLSQPELMELDNLVQAKHKRLKWM